MILESIMAPSIKVLIFGSSFSSIKPKTIEGTIIIPHFQKIRYL